MADSESIVAYDPNVPGLKEFGELKRRVIFEESELSSLQKNMIATVISRINGSKICTVAHATHASKHAQDPDLYEALIRDSRRARISEADRAMLDYVAKLAETPQDIAVRDIQNLREHGFSDNAIMEMVMTSGVMGMMNRLRLGTIGELMPYVASEAERLGMGRA